MANITTRIISGANATVKNSPLNNNEVDANFNNINAELPAIGTAITELENQYSTAFALGTSQYTEVDATHYCSFGYNAHYSSTSGLYVGYDALTPNDATAAPAHLFDPALGSIIWKDTGNGVGGISLITNTVGNDDENLWVYGSRIPYNGNTFYLTFMLLSDTNPRITLIRNESLLSLGGRVLSATNAYVFYTRSGSPYVIHKGTYAKTGLSASLPAGWTIYTQGATTLDDNTHLILVENTTTSEWGFVTQTGTGDISAVSNKFTAATVGCDANLDFKGEPCKVGNSVYWQITGTFGGSPIDKLLITTASGYIVDVVDLYNPSARSNVGGFTRLVHNNGYLYYIINSIIYRYEIATGFKSSVTPPYPAGLTITEGRNTAIACDGTNLITKIRRVNSVGYGLERLEIL